MLDPTTSQLKASFDDANELAGIIIKALSEEEASIGYGLLACSLTIARLLNPGKRLGDDEEIKFVEALMEWSGMYWECEGKVN